MNLDTWIENLEDRLCDYSITQRHKVLNRVSKVLEQYKTDDLTEQAVLSQLGTVEDIISSSLVEQTRIILDAREISSILPMKPKQVVETSMRVANRTRFVVFGPISLTLKALMLITTYWLPILAAPLFFAGIGSGVIQIDGAFDYLLTMVLFTGVALSGSVAAIFAAEIFDKISRLGGKNHGNKALSYVANINVGRKFSKRQGIYMNFLAIGATCLLAYFALHFISTSI